MQLIRSTILLGVLALGVSALPAQDEGERTDEADTPREAPEQQPAPDEGSEDAPRTEGAPRSEGDDVFVPTEELDADEEVTFPVDI